MPLVVQTEGFQVDVTQPTADRARLAGVVQGGHRIYVGPGGSAEGPLQVAVGRAFGLVLEQAGGATQPASGLRKAVADKVFTAQRQCGSRREASFAAAFVPSLGPLQGVHHGAVLTCPPCRLCQQFGIFRRERRAPLGRRQ